MVVETERSMETVKVKVMVMAQALEVEQWVRH
jgi:hypothetical protein